MTLRKSTYVHNTCTQKKNSNSKCKAIIQICYALFTIEEGIGGARRPKDRVKIELLSG